MTAFDTAWSVVKADSGMTSGTPGTNNPRHGPTSAGRPKKYARSQRNLRAERKRRTMGMERPPGYGKGSILDPNRQKTTPKRAKEESEPLDAEALLAENKKIVGKSASNLLFALGLFRKGTEKMYGPGFFDPLRNLKEQAKGGTDNCEICGLPKRGGDNELMFSDDEMCDCDE